MHVSHLYFEIEMCFNKNRYPQPANSFLAVLFSLNVAKLNAHLRTCYNSSPHVSFKIRWRPPKLIWYLACPRNIPLHLYWNVMPLFKGFFLLLGNSSSLKLIMFVTCPNEILLKFGKRNCLLLQKISTFKQTKTC